MTEEQTKENRTKRFHIDKHDVGHYVIRDRVEECGWPAGRELAPVDKLITQLNQLTADEQTCVDFRVSDGALYISYAVKCDRLTHDWKMVVANCH